MYLNRDLFADLQEHESTCQQVQLPSFLFRIFGGVAGEALGLIFGAI